MADEDGVECTRCGATFETDEELMVHSVDVHAGHSTDAPETDRGTGDATGASSVDVDPETAERLLAALEERTVSPGGVLVSYGERFLLAASLLALVVVLVLTGLFVADVVGIAVYMFSLGTLFGLTLSYLQGFLQSVRR